MCVSFTATCFSKMQKGHKLARFLSAVIILLISLVIFVSYVDFNSDSLKQFNFENVARLSYLINTTHCKIPDLDPLNEDVLPFVNVKEKYLPCSAKPLLSYIERTDNVVQLKINKSVIPLYSYLHVRCCYAKILRRENDTSVTHSKCKNFYNEVNITYPYIRVICRSIIGVVYQNVHAVILTQKIKEKLPKTENKDTSKKWKILMVGIDSISKLNLQRTMPKVYAYLERNAISLNGYNKIEDNTFPNVMAILTGRSMDTLSPICLRNDTFDRCDLIWKDFQESGYATTYGEDEPFLNTFNYFKKGFADLPTSVYLRPYFLSAYLLPIQYKHMMAVCTGPQNTAERMLDAAKDFSTAFKHVPTFALYWMNSFSHEDVNYPTTMNNKLYDFLHDPIVTDAIQDSIFILFSDHGFRFGDIRFTYSGWLEERLPFIYFRFPQSFEQAYPDLVNNFIFNAKNRLTTPYDFHMTLQHVLKLSNDSYEIKPSLGCPKCKSLFEKINSNRTCEDAAIPEHYCTCEGYTRISTKTQDVLKVAAYVVNEINTIIKDNSQEGYKCAKYLLSKIETVGKSNSVNSKSSTYLILVKTYPYAMFEATVKMANDKFELMGQISRLNKYAAYSGCVNNDILKKYCFCDSWTTKILSGLCYLFRCPVY